MKVYIGFNVLSKDAPLMPQTDEEIRIGWADPMGPDHVDFEMVRLYVSQLIGSGHTFPDGKQVEFINLDLKVT